MREDVEEALAEYCFSLNEIAAAVRRLLDEEPLTLDDTLAAVGHVWNAYECNEAVAEFSPREDGALCHLLAQPLPRPS